MDYMVAKGRSNYEAKVDDTITALENLISYVPHELRKTKQKIESDLLAVTEEYEDWDEENHIRYKRVWHPSLDTTIFDTMEDLFYSSIVQDAYSQCEKLLCELTIEKKKPSWPKGKGKRPSDILLYYAKIAEDYKIALPEIKTYWPSYEEFHSLRLAATHYRTVGNMKVDMSSFILENLKYIKRLLLKTEKTIIDSKR